MKLQSSAVPYRLDDKGEVEVLLVSSRRRRWVFPKGKIKRGTLPHVSAAHEAFEEAGVLGRIARVPLGEYRQRKALANSEASELLVKAFALKVEQEARAWPEMTIRQRQWLSIEAAFQAVQDVELRAIIRKFEANLAAGV
jgi:8-oxo-dGTP pyrophosphatase MutT (NUDIX family)